MLPLAHGAVTVTNQHARPPPMLQACENVENNPMHSRPSQQDQWLRARPTRLMCRTRTCCFVGQNRAHRAAALRLFDFPVIM